MDIDILRDIGKLADEWYDYLPDNLKNKNYLNELLIDLQRGVKSPGNNIAYIEIIKSIATYLEEVDISAITWSIQASPTSWNAPLTTTLRVQAQDPMGTKIETSNYTWWIDSAGKRVVVGRGPTINYTFRDQWLFSMFVDITSTHRNAEGNIDVLPFRSKVDISVNEKIASLIVNINGDRVVDGEELKFTPENADYGLVFDATSSTPTDGTTFTKTVWDFWNGVTKTYSWGPKIERVRYGRQGDFPVTMQLYTNEGKIVESNFIIYVRDPIAKIEVNKSEWYIGDNFTFSAKSSGIYRDLSYSWEIINIDTDQIIHRKTDQTLTYVFTNKGKYNVQLKTRRANGDIDQDTRIVYVTSQAPIAEFETKKNFSHKPNKIFFDASRSFDPDFSDDGKLTYQWIINGNKVNLDESSANGSIGYYTFDSVGTQSITLEVTDPDGILTIKQWTVDVDSILSVEMFAFPRVIQRENFIKFTAESPEAEVFEWDFGDGKTQWGALDKVTHTYDKSGTFTVTLKVTDKDNNANTYKRTVYVSDSDSPLSVIDVSYGSLEQPSFDENACDWVWAYVGNRVQNISFGAGESINIDGENSWLEYSWKIGVDKYSSATSLTHRFDELGCFPVKLTVKSDDNSKTHSSDIMIDVRNVVPQLSALSVDVTNPEEDPLIIDVQAYGATDPDGVVQSYLWYYYTDIDAEPQDFRSTTWPSTSFVLPKITWNYYFVSILKDNNEARITSEEATWARYFTTITGDNINTPIVELSVDDNSTIIGEEVVFTANAQNILGQDVSKDATFSWDFDGDGFYDTQTKEATTTHKYKKSGEFYAKVKVKYKGISSTKNITMNVWNKLIADFGYISIGNKYIFFDASSGTVDSRKWDLWDGNVKTGTYFEYSYTDSSVTHDVKLTISEGTKVKEVTKTVTKNVKNILKSRGKPLATFTYPIAEEGKIVLESPQEKVFVYLGESSDPAVAYVIDYDIENDSDLNGGLDDDEDNKWTASYLAGDVMEIPFSPYALQTIRVYTKDESGNILASEDIILEKNYIEEVEINPDMIIFENVTESEKEKIEALKAVLIKLPQQQRIRSLNYIQKLQENWNDDTEKTRTILDFENYIFELGLENEDEFISLLESLLVEWQEDQSAKQITYQALVNLVPADIQCETTGASCYDTLLSKLADIKASDDTVYNKALGTEILEAVKSTDLMTTDQKLDFKAILTSLVYGWNVEDIPVEEKQEVIDESPQNDDSEWSGVLWILIAVLKILLWLIIVFLVLVGIFYLIYLVVGKKQNKTFTEFITRTTSLDEWSESKNDVFEVEDVLASPSSDMISKKPSEDPLKTEKKPVEKKADSKAEEVPDWLKGSFDDGSEKKTVDKDLKQKDTKAVKPESDKKDTAPEKTIEKSDNSKPERKKEVEKPFPKQNNPTEKKAVSDKVRKDDAFDLEKDTKLTTEENVPDWLKGSFGAKDKKQAVSKDAIKENSSKQEDIKKVNPEVHKNSAPKKEAVSQKNSQVKNDTSEENVPDWLKGSMSTAEENKQEKNNASTQSGKALSSKAPEKVDTPSDAKPKVETIAEKKPELKKDNQKNVDSSKTKNTSEENVPDWLKWSFDTKWTTQKAEKKSELPTNKTNLKGESNKVAEVKSKWTQKNEQASNTKTTVNKTQKKEAQPQKSSTNTNSAAKKQNSEKQVSQQNKKTQDKGESNKDKNPDQKQKTSVQQEKQSPKTQAWDKKTDSKEKASELWDDGMKIPDWLKSDDTK